MDFPFRPTIRSFLKCLDQAVLAAHNINLLGVLS